MLWLTEYLRMALNGWGNDMWFSLKQATSLHTLAQVSIHLWCAIPSAIKIVGWYIFTLGATTFNKEFVQHYTKFAAELLAESDLNGTSSDNSSSDSEEIESKLSELSDSGCENQGTAFFPNIETCSNMPTSHSTSI